MLSRGWNNRTMLGCWIVGAFLAAMIITMVFGEPRKIVGQSEGDWFRNLIYDFQTLITGFLAVGAAYFTISQSHAIDDRAQKRHEELFELQMRPDKLRIARAYPEFEKIREWGLKLFSTAVPTVVPGRPFSPVEESQIRRSRVMCVLILTAMKDTEFAGIRDLFDGNLHTLFNGLERRLDRAQDRLEVLVAPDGEMVKLKESFVYYYEQPMTTVIREQVRKFVVDDLLESREFFDKFRAAFAAWAKHYEIG